MTISKVPISMPNCESWASKAPLFVVNAASNAGKGTMMEMLNLIGSDRVQILSKIVKRNRKQNDKNDGMLPIGTPESPLEWWDEWPDWWSDEMISTAKRGHFPKEYDFDWSFHGKSVQYAVSDQEITRNLGENRAQIVISNTDQIDTETALSSSCYIAFLQLRILAATMSWRRG